MATQQDINRRRMLAKALMSQQAPQGSMAGRFYVRPSTAATVIPAIANIAGMYQGDKADTEQGQLEEDQKAQLAEALRKMTGVQAPAPSSPPVMGFKSPQSPVDPRQEAALSVLRGLPLDQQREIVGQQAVGRLFPQPQKGFTLAPGQARFDSEGKQVAVLPGDAKPEAGFVLGLGQRRFDASGKEVASVPMEPPKPEQPTPTQLVTRPGPNGMLQDYAFDPRSKQLTPVADPYQKQAPLSPKDTSTVKQKLTQISIARQQLANARQKFDALKDSFSAGPGGGLLPTESGKSFDAAIDGMRGTISSLVRVPGIGAMSDYETRLDQSKFPKRGEYESVTAQKLDQLDSLLGGLEGGYADMLGGASDASTPDMQPQNSAPAEAIEYLRSNPQFRDAFKEKYGYLPQGM